ncbi:hypothetical protein Prum_028470 [Phytohabitans rumicis]|uniref:Putative mannosyltransferase YkcA/B-like C-terminal domain-containing protein n=1 Tax=Phytohabitans rumicis TaxID=1076125 RepID=A0A6V8L934_9ACTN|nr:hypothetical protein [Phytohabitans rumicis]GFJ89205.1 hypothetical protein Prum_028470 [Phytohabitans rumicis]
MAGLWATRLGPRTDRTRAAVVLWGGWLIVTGLVFSYMQGTVHPYYSVALAPAIAGLVAVVGRELWRQRDDLVARVFLAAMVGVTGFWSFRLLARTPAWHPELRYAVAATTAVVVLGMLVPPRRLATAAAVVALGGVLTLVGGSGGYALATAAVPHSGSIPSAGPSVSPRGGFGGDASADSALSDLLKATTTTWAAATSGSQTAASLQLASGRPVMAMGGFTGSDPAPTLAQFQQWVQEGKISYFVAGGRGGGGGGGPGGRGSGGEIATWVQENYTATTVGGTTVYDLRG